MPDEYLTTAQAAERLAMTISRVQQLCRAGVIEADRHGRDWAIRPEALARMSRQRRPYRSRETTREHR